MANDVQTCNLKKSYFLDPHVDFLKLKCLTFSQNVRSHKTTKSRLLFPPQSSCPVTTRRRPTTPAQEAPTDWTAFPLDPQTPLTPRPRPPEAGWRPRWRAPQSRRSWAPSSSKTSTWRSRYREELGWKIRWESADALTRPNSLIIYWEGLRECISL